MKHPTGADLLAWLVEQMKNSLAVRMDVPHWKGQEVRDGWLRELRSAYAEALDDGVLDRYLAHADSVAHTRPIINLSEDSGKLPSVKLSAETRLRLAKGRRLSVSVDSAGVAASFTAQGTEWRCHAGLAPALRMLNHSEPSTLAQMRESVAKSAIDILQPYLISLITAGIVWAETSISKDGHRGHTGAGVDAPV
jgi:hypothetical protein